MLRASTQTRRLQYIDRLRTKQHELQAALELATANSREQCITSLAGWDREAGMAVTHNVDDAIVDKTGVAGVDIVMHYAEERLRL